MLGKVLRRTNYRGPLPGQDTRGCMDSRPRRSADDCRALRDKNTRGRMRYGTTTVRDGRVAQLDVVRIRFPWIEEDVVRRHLQLRDRHHLHGGPSQFRCAGKIRAAIEGQAAIRSVHVHRINP